MKPKWMLLGATGLILASLAFISSGAVGQKPDPCVDEALCAKMIRFGKEAYLRGKYLDAKEYFRKAIKADPDSAKAWVFYDQSAVFALAEKVEKNADLVLPGVSTRKEAPSEESAEAPPPPAKEKPEEEEESIEFEIVEDEGC